MLLLLLSVSGILCIPRKSSPIKLIGGFQKYTHTHKNEEEEDLELTAAAAMIHHCNLRDAAQWYNEMEPNIFNWPRVYRLRWRCCCFRCCYFSLPPVSRLIFESRTKILLKIH